MNEKQIQHQEALLQFLNYLKSGHRTQQALINSLGNARTKADEIYAMPGTQSDIDSQVFAPFTFQIMFHV